MPAPIKWLSIHSWKKKNNCNPIRHFKERAVDQENITRLQELKCRFFGVFPDSQQ